MKFVQALYQQNNQATVNFSVIDTLRLAQRRIAEPPSYKLADLAKHLGFEMADAHRAIDDATATAQLCVHVLKTYKHPQTALKKNRQTVAEFAQEHDDEQLARRLRKLVREREAGLERLDQLNRHLDELSKETHDRGGVTTIIVVAVLIALFVLFIMSSR